MFGGKKLKDLTEEDIRRYAASLASGGNPQWGDAGGVEEQGTATKSAPSREALAASPSAARQLATSIVERSALAADDAHLPRHLELEQAVEEEGRQLQVARRAYEEDQERREKRQAQLEAQRQKQLGEEEQLRLQVLAELDRSQMPAVRAGDGSLQKTIEHYTFADNEDTATISIELDKDLFEGAAGFVLEENIQVCTKDTEVTILLHKVPASKTVAALAEWRLHISPLFHSVEPDETKWKVRKGKLSVKLKKRKAQEWRRLVKF